LEGGKTEHHEQSGFLTRAHPARRIHSPGAAAFSGDGERPILYANARFLAMAGCESLHELQERTGDSFPPLCCRIDGRKDPDEVFFELAGKDAAPLRFRAALLPIADKDLTVYVLYVKECAPAVRRVPDLVTGLLEPSACRQAVLQANREQPGSSWTVLFLRLRAGILGNSIAEMKASPLPRLQRIA
jgi:hypothetical protein